MENIPIILAQYRMGKTLGIGAFGKVKLAQHTITGQKVAIKILNKGKIKHMEMAEKVRREINILKMCKHPHIIRLYEVIDTPSDIFVIMEYVAGGELFDYIVSRGRLPADEARHFFHQIVSGVEYCHFYKVVHRDLKPENLLLDSDNNIKLADFGLSNVVHDGDFLRTSCGSPNYAAPEVICGNLYAGAEVDVWSCGVILYALLCGTLPFDDESIPNLFKKIKSGMYSLPSHLSQLSRDLILRMLVVDPMKRSTIQEVRQHPWFQHKLPAYLALPPDSIEQQERCVDPEIVSKVCMLKIGSITVDTVETAVMSPDETLTKFLRKVKVTYELLLDAKRHKLRIADVVLARQDGSRTPPVSTTPRGGGVGTSPATATAKLEMNVNASSGAAGAGGGGGSSGSGSGAMNAAAMSRQSAAMMDTRDQPTRRGRRWYLGIQSKKDPGHVMTEVYKAMLSLGCKWHATNNYRVLCVRLSGSSLKRRHTSSSEAYQEGKYGGSIDVDEIDAATMHHHHGNSNNDAVAMDIVQPAGSDNSDSSSSSDSPVLPVGGVGVGVGMVLPPREDAVKIALSLYKVQQNIYLLDFQHVEGDIFGFMQLCSHIITELKNLSAASRAAPHLPSTGA